MHVKLAYAALGDRQILQDFGLERRAESLRVPDAIILCRSFQIRKRGDTQILVKSQHFFGPQPGDGEHLQYPGWDFLAELLQTGMGARTMQLGDYVGDGFANAWNFGEPLLLRSGGSRGSANPARLSAARE